MRVRPTQLFPEILVSPTNLDEEIKHSEVHPRLVIQLVHLGCQLDRLFVRLDVGTVGPFPPRSARSKIESSRVEVEIKVSILITKDNRRRRRDSRDRIMPTYDIHQTTQPDAYPIQPPDRPGIFYSPMQLFLLARRLGV